MEIFESIIKQELLYIFIFVASTSLLGVLLSDYIKKALYSKIFIKFNNWTTHILRICFIILCFFGLLKASYTAYDHIINEQNRHIATLEYVIDIKLNNIQKLQARMIKESEKRDNLLLQLANNLKIQIKEKSQKITDTVHNESQKIMNRLNQQYDNLINIMRETNRALIENSKDTEIIKNTLYKMNNLVVEMHKREPSQLQLKLLLDKTLSNQSSYYEKTYKTVFGFILAGIINKNLRNYKKAENYYIKAKEINKLITTKELFIGIFKYKRYNKKFEKIIDDEIELVQKMMS
jgi:hypothetical protein